MDPKKQIRLLLAVFFILNIGIGTGHSAIGPTVCKGFCDQAAAESRHGAGKNGCVNSCTERESPEHSCCDVGKPSPFKNGTAPFFVSQAHHHQPFSQIPASFPNTGGWHSTGFFGGKYNYYHHPALSCSIFILNLSLLC